MAGLSRRSEVARVFGQQPSARLVAAALALAVGVRLRAGRPGPLDAVALGAVVAARPLVEWGVHRHVLHARAPALAGAHPAHHDDPTRLDRILLRAPHAAADALAVAAVAGALACAAARRRTPVAWTAVATGEAGLLAYEWCHLLIHTAYRPRSSWFRRIRAAHRRHHADPTREFGVTATIADRLLGTGPRRARRAVRVGRSGTAR